MEFVLPPLPYSKDALAPHIGPQTLELHYEKHHRGYLQKLEERIGGTPDARKSLEELIRTSEGPVFDAAAQVWNHSFYWNSMVPGGGGKPGRGAVADAIVEAFGSWGGFEAAFVEAASALFGSGYVWLVLDVSAGRVSVLTTSDADNPIARRKAPLLGLDLWEHAYYLDYHHERGRYVRAFVDSLLNWGFVEENLRAAR